MVVSTITVKLVAKPTIISKTESAVDAAIVRFGFRAEIRAINCSPVMTGPWLLLMRRVHRSDNVSCFPSSSSVPSSAGELNCESGSVRANDSEALPSESNVGSATSPVTVRATKLDVSTQIVDPDGAQL